MYCLLDIKIAWINSCWSVKVSFIFRRELIIYPRTKEWFWNDSLIMLDYYIKHDAKAFNNFLANKVRLIKENSNVHLIRENSDVCHSMYKESKSNLHIVFSYGVNLPQDSGGATHFVKTAHRGRYMQQIFQGEPPLRGE